MIAVLFATDSLPLPAQGGILGAMLVVCGVFFKFMRDAREDGYTLADERLADTNAVEERCKAEIARLTERVATLEGAMQAQQASFLEEMAEQRRQKHDAVNELTPIKWALDLGRQFAEKCTCEAMTPWVDVLERRKNS